MLDVKTDGVDGGIGARHCIGDRLLVVDIGFDRMKTRIMGIKQAPASLKMP
jgi:hypothetical protein